MMANFPDDIVMDILARLPVKSILRFRCVNKTWCKLLKDRKFVQKHLNHATEMNRFSLLVSSDKDIYTMRNDPPSSISDHPLKTNCPVRSKSGIQVCGYCDGLVCISSGGAKILFLWNPATQEYKKLPIPQLQFPRPHIVEVEYGFGYDDKSDDFKVVFVASYRHIPRIEVHIYTLRCDSWRYIGEFPYDLAQDSRMSDIAHVPVNGALHWIAVTDCDDDDSEAIIYFDFEKETFEKMPLPKFADPDFSDDDMFDYTKFVRRLCVLGGSLCLQCSNREASIDVWQLDNETRSSWTKLFTVDQQKLFGFVADWMPLWSFENGRILVGLEKKDIGFHMIMYDPKDESIKPLGRFQFASECLLRTSVYVESLVSLNSGTYLWQGPVLCTKEEEGYYLDMEEEEEEDDSDSDSDSDSESDEEDDFSDSDEVDDYDYDDEHIGDDWEEDDDDEDEEEDDEQEDTEKRKKEREEDDKRVLDDIRKMFTTRKKPKM